VALAGTGGTQAGATGQAAVLNAALSSAGSPSPSGSAAPDGKRRIPLGRLRALGGIHGEFTFRTKTGTRTLAFERGVIQSASGGGIVVRAPDGTTWTWEFVSSTVVRDNGKPAQQSSLADGQTVFTGGPVTGSTRDARLVVIKTAAGGSATPPAPSASASPSGS
jgi:hypothetical protein